MSPWQCLDEELNRWSDLDKPATFWWRDDDAVAPTPQLERLLKYAELVPLCLAVIPGLAVPELATRLAELPSVAVLQHGWNHLNHAADGKSEYPSSRSADDVGHELAAGRSRLTGLFGGQLLPVFVPPWHGFASRFLGLLPLNGITHISRIGPRPSMFAADNLGQVNTHVAPIRWTVPRSFGDETDYLLRIIDHLHGRRTGQYHAAEATGLLTHHLVQDDASYRFISRLLSVTLGHPAVCWLDGRTVFSFSFERGEVCDSHS
jgi:hypothetical protein